MVCVYYVYTLCVYIYIYIYIYIYSKGKGKFRTRTDHESPEWEPNYSCIPFLTSVLDGVGGQRHYPATLPPGKTRYPLPQNMTIIMYTSYTTPSSHPYRAP